VLTSDKCTGTIDGFRLSPHLFAGRGTRPHYGIGSAVTTLGGHMGRGWSEDGLPGWLHKAEHCISLPCAQENFVMS
jgi:hypothetical protein